MKLLKIRNTKKIPESVKEIEPSYYLLLDFRYYNDCFDNFAADGLIVHCKKRTGTGLHHAFRLGLDFYPPDGCLKVFGN